MDGILVANKPAGPDVARRRRARPAARGDEARRARRDARPVRERRPAAVPRAGDAVVEYHLGDTKGYRATVCFGASSTTDDLEGELTPADGPAPARDAVEAALPRFLGEIAQRPPAYSAIKVAGRRAYAMARAGETVELRRAAGDDRGARDP